MRPGWLSSSGTLIEELRPDLVVSDVITVCGGMAAELLGIPWAELTPHPLYLPSKGLPPIGSGLAPEPACAAGCATASCGRSPRARSGPEAVSVPPPRAGIGLPAADPGPRRRLIATLPALEVPRPDWPAEAVVVGPLHFEPTDTVLALPPGTGR